MALRIAFSVVHNTLFGTAIALFCVSKSHDLMVQILVSAAHALQIQLLNSAKETNSREKEKKDRSAHLTNGIGFQAENNCEIIAETL